MSDTRVMTSSGWREMRGTSDGKALTAVQLFAARDKKALAAAGDYTAEDVLSNSATAAYATPWLFINMGEGGYISAAHALCSTTGLTPRLTLYLFRRKPTTAQTDNAANTEVSTTDAGNYVGKIDFPAMEDLGGMSESIATPSTSGNLPLAYMTDDGTLYGTLVTRDNITGEAAGMTVEIILKGERY